MCEFNTSIPKTSHTNFNPQNEPTENQQKSDAHHTQDAPTAKSTGTQTEKTVNASTISFDLKAAADSATQMAQLLSLLMLELREAAQVKAEIVLQKMQLQVDFKQQQAQVIETEAIKAKAQGDEAAKAQKMAAIVNILGASMGAFCGLGVGGKVSNAQAGSAVSSMMTTGFGGGAGIESAAGTEHNNLMTEIQEKSRAQQTELDASSQQMATLQQRATMWEQQLTEIQQTLFGLIKELYSQAPNTTRNIGHNI